MTMRSLLAVGMLTLGAVAANAQDEVSPETRWGQVAACAAERSNESRHACVDGILRAAGALDVATETRVNRENFGRVERPVQPSAVAQPPAVAPEAAAQRAPIAPPALLDGVSTQVASARTGSDRKLLVETVEGAMWHQTDSSVIRRTPRPGEAFDVREGAMGSFICTANRSISFRCERRN